MIKININLFKDCIFDGNLNDDSYESKILDKLPKDFKCQCRTGASKLVLIPDGAKYVFKIPFNRAYKTSRYFHLANDDENRKWDYCFKESLIYRQAKKENLHSLFAPERFVGEINKHPIYIQALATISSDLENERSYYCSEKERQRSKKLQNEVGYRLNTTWLAEAIKWHGENRVKRLLFFLCEYDLNDFHSKNIGYIGNRPVLIDYSSFWD